ncbi:MAG: TonB-dependent receptor [Saprospiraceae bacterium]|nr:TonB-dependent receptor [Saprospiraceae bacterium]
MKKHIYLLFLLLTTFSYAQQHTVSGKITDSSGEALIGTSILEKGTSNGTVSDFNGNYELTVSSADATIVVSYIGYVNVEVILEGQNRLDITMNEAVQELEEVVVTGFSGVVGRARKRTESIQRTPESVTALNSEGIEKAGIGNITDFAQLVPNLKLSETQAAGVNFLIVRGIPQIRNADAPVAFVIDGVTIPDPSLLNQELFDLALIEAVKGPQGALYGKNAIGGAINIYSKEPTNTFKNKLKLGYGNGNAFTGQFISSGAIQEDKVFYRLSTQYQNFDGLLTNDFLDKKVDFSKDLTLRGQIIANLSSNLKATVTAQYIDTEAGATYYSISPSSVNNDGWLEALDPNPEDGNNVISQDVFGESELKNLFTSVNLQYKFDKVKLQSITAYSDVQRMTVGDLDFTEVFVLDQGETNDTKSFNQELRLTSLASDSKVSWSLGGFYQNVERPFFQSDALLSAEWAVTDYTNTVTTLALFGFMDYQLSEKLTAALGVRYDNDNFEQDDRLGDVVNERSNNILQPKVSLSYQANESVMLYTNYGRGYRAGGFNPQVTDLYNGDYKDELSDNYEIGFKTSSWNNRFLFNGSVFYSNFKDRQQFAVATEFFIPGNFNYEKSTIVGFEIDTKLRPSKYLDVLFSYGFVDSKIDEGGFTGGANGMTTDLNQFNGNITSFVPRNNFNFGLASSVNVTEKATLDVSVNLNGTGKIYWSDFNSDDTTSDGYQLLDAQASITVDKIQFTLWGRNLLNKQYYLEYDPFGFGWRGQPATYGATIGIEF